MLEEASDAFVCGKRAALPLGACTLLAAEGDVPVFKLFDAVVREGNATDGGAREAMTSVPVPAGAQWVTHGLRQTWAGTSPSRSAWGSSCLHFPRKIFDRARTGTSQSA